MSKCRKFFNDIYTSYYKSLFFFAKSYVIMIWRQKILPEALIKLWKLKAESVEEKYILPLLLTILKNKALDYLKHEEVKRSAFSDGRLATTGIVYPYVCLEACNPDEIFRKKWNNH